MTGFFRQRSVGVVVLGALTGGLMIAVRTMETALMSPRVWLGWVLGAMVLFLAVYQIRKQLPMLPLGPSARWLQLHIFVGILALPVFLLHTGPGLPHGLIEVSLGVTFLIVFASGCIGLLLSRMIPPRLTDRGEEVIYERIPVFIRLLREQAEACVLGSPQDPPSPVIGELYLNHLQPFFQRPANLLRHILHSAKPRTELLKTLHDARRFLRSDDDATMTQLVGIVTQKDDLDYQYAMQSLLKYWMFVHVPLTWALMVLAAFHIGVAMAFNSG